MTIDEIYRIDTPENVEFNYNVAGIGSRFLAAIIDTALLILIQVILWIGVLVVMALLEDVSQAAGIDTDILGSFIIAGAIILGFIFFWGYYLFFELLWNGQSPGKRVVRLRVVREGGRPIAFTSSAIRNLVRLIDFLPGFYGLGVLVMFVDQRARRLGDLAGGTLVVKERQAVSLSSLTARAEPLPLPPRRSDEPQEPLPNLHLLTDQDYNLVQEFLRRRKELGRASRTRLGVQLANNLHDRLGMTSEGGDHERFLELVAYDYRRTREQSVQTQQ